MPNYVGIIEEEEFVYRNVIVKMKNTTQYCVMLAWSTNGKSADVQAYDDNTFVRLGVGRVKKEDLEHDENGNLVTYKRIVTYEKE